jgi:hypothetical protein
MKKTHRGSCHCGGVRFECELDLAAGTTRCNCRFCTKARMWFALVPRSELRILAGEELLTDYQRAAPTRSEPFLHFTFCRLCGVRPFTSGGIIPPATEGFYAVNVASLDDVDDASWASAPIHYADGRNDDWPSTPEVHSYL